MNRSFKLNSGYTIPAVRLGTWQSKPNEVKVAAIAALKVGVTISMPQLYTTIGKSRGMYQDLRSRQERYLRSAGHKLSRNNINHYL